MKQIVILILTILMMATAFGEQKESPQIVFSVMQDINKVRIITPASNFITVLGIVPADPAIQYAPLNRGDIMLCRPYDGTAENGQKVFGLRCGTDSYFVQALALVEKKKDREFAEPKKRTPNAPDLKEEYDKYNLKYFSNKLPKDTITIWGNPNTIYGVEVIALTTKLDDGRFQIMFNPKFGMSRYFTLFVLLHEMAHINTWSNDLAHGPTWQKEMHRLADEGAFELLW